MSLIGMPRKGFSVVAYNQQKRDREKRLTRRFTPATCPHCEYDRRFPGFEAGGWIQQENNGPIVSCPMCNDDGAHPRETSQCGGLG